MGMDDFDKRWNDRRRRGDRIRRQASVIMWLTWICMGATLIAGAYLLFHPKVIGSFAGKIVAGYKSADTEETKGE